MNRPEWSEYERREAEEAFRIRHTPIKPLRHPSELLLWLWLFIAVVLVAVYLIGRALS